MQKAIGLGDKVELVTELTESGDQDQYYSKVQEVLDDERVVIMAPMESGRIVPLELQKIYGMCVYTNRGLFRCEVAVVERKRDENLYLITLEIVSSLQKYQRRQYYRLDCMLSFQYKDDDEEQWHTGMIVDLSGGGMRFTSKEALVEKKGVVNHIVLEHEQEERNLYLSGIVVGTAKVRPDDNLFENRIEFDAISNEDRELIIRYIFEEERRRRKNKKGL